MTAPRYHYGWWPELELIEVGKRVAFSYDEPNALEHRFAAAGGPPYGCPPAHWQWK